MLKGDLSTMSLASVLRDLADTGATGSLVLTEKRLFTKVVHDTSSPCGDPVTLEVCVKENRACKRCLPAARAVAKMVSKGEGEKEIREWLENRFDDKSVKQIEIGQSPSLGPANAPLTIVEFADFECPHWRPWPTRHTPGSTPGTCSTTPAVTSPRWTWPGWTRPTTWPG